MTFYNSNSFAKSVTENGVVPRTGKSFWIAKRAFDLIVTCLVLLPLMLVFSVLLLILNPFLNPGPLFYGQVRMGRDCRAFKAYKFRSMAPADRIERGPNDPLERDRISKLGHFIRKTRIDELAQAINVIRGDMSLIGPRPDYFHHARRFVRDIPAYRDRHQVRPGITGLAQIDVGYVETYHGVVQKALADIHYIQNAGFWMDTKIAIRTVLVVLGFRGS